jgi:hypothetical protein
LGLLGSMEEIEGEGKGKILKLFVFGSTRGEILTERKCTITFCSIVIFKIRLSTCTHVGPRMMEALWTRLLGING